MTLIKAKIVVVGDGACGKTCLLKRFVDNSFPDTYVPCTAFDNYVADMTMDGKEVELSLWDTAGSEDYDKVRVFSYPKMDVALACFSIDDPNSLRNLPNKWIPDIKTMCPDTTIIVVGNKKDLRDDKAVIEKLRKTDEEPISTEHGTTVAQMIGAFYYIECSALKNEGILDVFQIATKAILKAAKRRNSSCVLM